MDVDIIVRDRENCNKTGSGLYNTKISGNSFYCILLKTIIYHIWHHYIVWMWYVKNPGSFPNLSIALWTLFKIPVSLASAQRSFSELKLIKIIQEPQWPKKSCPIWPSYM